MKIKTITYSKTVQAKQYEPARLEVTAELDENDNLQQKTQELIDYVEKTLKPKSIKPEDF